jgi:N-glycosylase/DNA lyase
MIEDNHPVFLSLAELPMDESRSRIMQYPGIGPKVADCVLLYGFHRLEAFPIDVWIRRKMQELYFANRVVPAKQILRFAARRWGPWAGYVQQYIFHAARKRVL